VGPEPWPVSSADRTRHGGPAAERPPPDRPRHPLLLHAGVPWRDLAERYGPWPTIFTRFNAERYGPWPTIFTRFNQWRRDGTRARIVTSLLDELDDEGRIDHDHWCIEVSAITPGNRVSMHESGDLDRGGIRGSRVMGGLS
jgi:hypothetical protein